MSETTENKTCGRPDCFSCHFSNAVEAFTAHNADKAAFTPEQEKEILRVIAGTAGLLLSDQPLESLDAFIGAMMRERRRAQQEARAHAASAALMKAIFGTVPRPARD